jgi:DNA-binding XRE family transcriptional regulator
LLTTRERGRQRKKRTGAFKADRELQALVRDLVAARTAAFMNQDDVAAKMGTTKTAIPRLESGFGTRPTMTTIEKYALAVGASVEIRVRTRFPPLP